MLWNEKIPWKDPERNMLENMIASGCQSVSNILGKSIGKELILGMWETPTNAPLGKACQVTFQFSNS